MNKIFYPESIVVIGVSERPDNLAKAVSENMLRFHYQGHLYLIGRRCGELQGIPIYDSMEPLPENIDLAIILTPAATVPAYVEECGKKGIRNVIIESGGFSEFSPEGKVLEEQIGEIAAKWGIKIVGPNCIGIINTISGICSVFVTTEAEEMKKGRTAVISQSGGIVLTCTDLLTESGLGVGKTVSVGNKLNLKEADYLEYFLQDPDTEILLLYLESIDEGRELVDLGKKAKKPIIVYKSNTSQASARVAQSHTAALANDDKVVSAALKQAGIARVQTFRDMALLARGFSMPPVRGNRLCVFTRSGGQAIVSVDQANDFGFVLPSFPDELLETARPFFRANVIDSSNPLDLGTVFNFESYPVLIEACLRIVKPDAILLIFNYRRETIPTARKIADQIMELSRRYDTPVALCYLTEMPEVRYLQRQGYPVFDEVYDVIKAFSASRDHYLQQQKNAKIVAARADLVPQDACIRARQILSGISSGQPLIADALKICEAYGLPVAPWRVVEDVTQAQQQAKQVGYPLVVKAVSSHISHKSDVGGVALNIQNGKDLAIAIERMQTRIEQKKIAFEPQFLLQKMVSGGHEVILGGKRDRSFGPVLLFGLGGIYVEVYNDTSLRVAPISPVEVREMIAEIKGNKLLCGARGQVSADLAAIEDSLLRFSQLLSDLPEIAEFDINPLIVGEHGAQVVDARILLR